MRYVDPDGRIQIQVQAKYTMQTGSWGIITNTKISIAQGGCAIVGSANFTSSIGTSNDMTPSQINEKYVNSIGHMDFAALGKDLGFTVTKITGKLTHTILKTQDNDKSNIYLTLVNVYYTSDKSADHWVGVKGIETVNGIEYIRITPTSNNDSNVSAGSMRGNQNWILSSDGTILMPVSATRGYVNFMKGAEDEK